MPPTSASSPLLGCIFSACAESPLPRRICRPVPGNTACPWLCTVLQHNHLCDALHCIRVVRARATGPIATTRIGPRTKKTKSWHPRIQKNKSWHPRNCFHPRTCIWYWNPPTKLYCMYMVLIWYSIFVLLKSTSPSISANQKLSNVRSIHGPGTGPSGTGDLKVGSTGNIGEVASSPAPPAFYNRLCCAVAGDCDRDSLWARALELQ